MGTRDLVDSDGAVGREPVARLWRRRCWATARDAQTGPACSSGAPAVHTRRNDMPEPAAGSEPQSEHSAQRQQGAAEVCRASWAKMEALKQHNDGQHHELDHEERAEPGGRHVRCPADRMAAHVAAERRAPARVVRRGSHRVGDERQKAPQHELPGVGIRAGRRRPAPVALVLTQNRYRVGVSHDMDLRDATCRRCGSTSAHAEARWRPRHASARRGAPHISRTRPKTLSKIRSLRAPV